jgi:hypothetical protein
MIYVLYSSDYEIYLGGNYRPEKQILVDTTENLLSACEDIGIPMTLFCDLLCFWRYRESGYSEFPDLVNHQLVNTIERGHDIQLHIHPHWSETKIIYDEKGTSRYDFDLSKYLLGNWFPEGGVALENFCTDILKRAISYLEDLLRPISPNYSCIAFRAGGCGLQPNEKEIIGSLLKSGILIDSSILPGLTENNNVNSVDFSGVPRQGNYYISPELGLNKVSEKGIFEIPILTLRDGEAKWLLVKALLVKVLKRVLSRQITQEQLGYTIQTISVTGKQKQLLPRMFTEKIDEIKHGWWSLELDSDASIMVDATRRYIERYDNKEGDLYFSFSCHSKDINLSYLKSLKKYQRRLENIYGKQFKALTFQQAACIKSLNKLHNDNQYKPWELS